VLLKNNMITFLKRLPIVKEFYRQASIEAFRLAQRDILETMADDLEERAKVLADKKLSVMMSPVDWKQVLTFNERQGLFYLGGQRLDQPQLLALKAEAEMLLASELWRVLFETPNALAQQAMFKTGEDTDAFKKGRAMIYHLDSQLRILTSLKSYSQKKS